MISYRKTKFSLENLSVFPRFEIPTGERNLIPVEICSSNSYRIGICSLNSYRIGICSLNSYGISDSNPKYGISDSNPKYGISDSNPKYGISDSNPGSSCFMSWLSTPANGKPVCGLKQSHLII